MKMKKTKEESTSSGTRKKKGSKRGGRLTDMFESMEKRASPVSAHKVATKYFEDFRKERHISQEGRDITAVDIGVSSAVSTAVGNALKESGRNRAHSKGPLKKKAETNADSFLSVSENKVYGVMYDERVKRKTDTLRLGLKELKEKTGLSDKTIRVSIHSLEGKKNIRVVEASLGVYGRKFRVLTPEEVSKERKRAGLVVDPTTKKIV